MSAVEAVFLAGCSTGLVGRAVLWLEGEAGKVWGWLLAVSVLLLAARLGLVVVEAWGERWGGAIG